MWLVLFESELTRQAATHAIRAARARDAKAAVQDSIAFFPAIAVIPAPAATPANATLAQDQLYLPAATAKHVALGSSHRAGADNANPHNALAATHHPPAQLTNSATAHPALRGVGRQGVAETAPTPLSIRCAYQRNVTQATPSCSKVHLTRRNHAALEC